MTLHLTQISNGEPTGTLLAEPGAAGTVAVRCAVDNNGRGAKLDEMLTLDDTGTPVTWSIRGSSLMGGAVRETFTRDADGIATWDSQADEGSTDARGHYVPADGSPYALVLVAERALTSGAPVPLLPSGTARVTLARKVEGTPEPVQVYRVTGIALRDQYVLFSAAGAPLGVFDGELWVADMLIPHVEAIRDAIQSISRDHLSAVARSAILHDRGRLVIEDVRVFDPRTGEVSGSRNVVVRDQLIEAVHEAHEAIPAHTTLVSGGGRVVVPGLHDMHAHLETSSAALYIAAGVTSVRDLGNENETLAELVKAIGTGALIGPSVVAAGFIEGRSDFSARFGKVVASLDEALEAVDWYADQGFHAIKIYNSFTPDWVPATATRAHERGLRVQGHIPAFMDADRAIASGYDEITHLNQLVLGWVLDPDEDTRTPLRLTALTRVADLDPDAERVRSTISTMVEGDISLDTTLVIIEQLMLSRARKVLPAHEPLVDNMPPAWVRGRKRTYVPARDADELAAYDRAFDRLLEITRRLHEVGIRLWPGTDDPTGVSLHRELELYVAAGLSPRETLRIATLACAEHLGRGDERGAIEPGRVADFILLDADPTTDISAVRKVALTVAEGRAYSPARIYEAFGIQPFASEPTTCSPSLEARA